LDFFSGSIDDALDAIEVLSGGASLSYVVTPNSHDFYLMETGGNEVRMAFGTADLTLLDSKFLVIVARLFGLKPPRSNPGADLVAALAKRRTRPTDRLCIVGGNAALVARTREVFTQIEIIHVDAKLGFMGRPGEADEICREIAASGANYIMFCISGPNQQLLASRLRSQGACRGVALCTGGALNFLTGMVPRAPAWLRAVGMEWLFRVITEPRRLAVRYFIQSPRALLLVFGEALGRRS
jgi:exopolysaccharide biosynthesis WecB/TagA/CpsF family protein